ncbi:hypothetical protein ACF0H5_015094 [Mactra antiquata]
MLGLGYIFTVVILVTTTPSVSADTKGYSLKYDIGKNLNVSIGNTLIFSHTPQSPMVFVGAGQLNFREFRGNFFINNYVEDRIGLPSFTVSEGTGNQDTIYFSYGNMVNLTMVLSSTNLHPLQVSVTISNPIFNDFWLRIVATPEEQVFGLGEQFSYLNLRHKNYPIWTREQGVGRNKSDIVTFFADKALAGGDYHTTYFPQPTFISDRKYYCHYDGTNYVEVNLQPLTFHEIYVNGDVGNFLFKTESSIKNLTQQLAKFLGLQPELPDWVYTGAILGVQGGTDVMLQRYKNAKKNGVPVSAIWIQDWAGVLKTSFGSRLFWDWKWNSTLYPDLKNKIKSLKDDGVRVLAYINPNLNTNGELFKQAAQGGYLVKNNSGQPYLTDFGEFYCGTVDLTSEAAKQWYKGVIQTNMIDLGLSGWMADFGEYLPPDGVVFQGNLTGREVHNKWPVAWAEVNRMAINERNVTGDVVFWTRSGGAGSGKYTTIMWAGDQNVDFSYGDGLPSTIPAALNLGMSGIGITHFDIGGYTTASQYKALGFALVRTEELLLRSAEAAIFTPMFRSHEGNQPKANVQFYSSEYIEKCFGRLASIFVHISNYTKNYVRDNALFGTPVQRPLFMEFPDDPTAWTITYQYMFGSDVLVAPVIESNVSTMNVYLPSGQWSYIWDSTDYTGSKFVTVNAPLGKPPAFFKKNSVWADVFSEIKTKFPLIPVPVTFSSTSKPGGNTNGVYRDSISVTLVLISLLRSIFI